MVGTLGLAGGLGITEEQSTRVLRSFPRVACLTMAARNAVAMRAWSAASSCQRHAVLSDQSKGVRDSSPEQKEGKGSPRVTSDGKVRLHAELSRKRRKDLSESGGWARVEHTLEQSLKDTISHLSLRMKM
jgi:hypothetical protein